MSALPARAVSGAFLLLLLIPFGAYAHAELEAADPAPDSTVEGSLTTVEATFTEPVDPSRSRLLVLDPAGRQIAEGGVDPGTTMTPAPAPSPTAPSPPSEVAADSALVPLAALGLVAALGAVLLLRRRSP